MIKTQEVILEPLAESKENAPKILTWKGEKMIRVHSIRATVREILDVSNSLDVVKVGIVGEESTGKTTLAETLAHLIHKMSDIPFTVRKFGKDELLNLQDTLASLTPANYVLIFDDVSFLRAVASARQIDILQETQSRIRHLPGGQDVKIIVIYNYHYSKALPPYLRQARFYYYTSIGQSERDHILKAVGKHYTRLIKSFETMFVEMTGSKKTATFEIKKNKFFIYQFRHPFAPCLFFNNRRLRSVVFPHRTWIEPLCTVCSQALNNDINCEVPVEQYVQESEDKFGKGTFEAAVKLKLFQNGMNVYSNKVVQAQRYLDRSLEKKIIPLEAIASVYDLHITKARLRKKLDGVLADETT